MIIVFLGDTGEYLSHIAQDYDASACLISQHNLDNLSSGIYYTSIGDVGGLVNLGKLLQQVDKIIYSPPPNNQWSGGTAMKNWTEDYLRIFSFRCLVENYVETCRDWSSITQLVDERKTQGSQLWIAGCSVSHGEGVDDQCRYGTLLSKKLDVPVSFLTAPGSSISWAADQILRSDIRDGDTLVWGLTSENRLPYIKDNTLHHVQVSTYVKNLNFENTLCIDELTSDNTVYRHLTSIFQVLNFCKKVKVRLVLAPLIDSGLISHLKFLPNLVLLTNLWGREKETMFLDLASDGSHPGPITHQFYADEIYHKILDFDNEDKIPYL